MDKLSLVIFILAPLILGNFTNALVIFLRSKCAGEFMVRDLITAVL